MGKDGLIYVIQRPEITRLRDSDNDGRADEYETVYDGWGLVGFENEFAFGLTRDRHGNLWGALAHNWKYGDSTRYGGWTFHLTPKGRFVPWSSGLRMPNGVGISPGGEVL